MWHEDAGGPSSTAFPGSCPLKRDVYFNDGASYNDPFWLNDPASTTHSLSDILPLSHTAMGSQMDDYPMYNSPINHDLSNHFSQMNLPSNHEGLDSTFEPLSFSQDASNFAYPINSMPSMDFSLAYNPSSYSAEAPMTSHQYPADGLGLPYPNNEDAYDMNMTPAQQAMWGLVDLEGHGYPSA